MRVLQNIFAVTAVELDQALRDMFLQARSVSPALLKHFSPQGYYSHGWEVMLPNSGAVVFILKPAVYPVRLIDIFVRDRSRFWPRPHMLYQGQLCLVPSDTQHHPANHINASLERITRADALLRRKLEDIPLEEWIAEIRAYWPTSSYRIVSLLAPHGPSRRIVSAVHDSYMYVADDAADLRAWLNRKYGVRRTWLVRPGALIWLDSPLRGPPFPTTVDDLLGFTPVARSVLHPLLTQRDEQSGVVIGWEIAEQTVLLGIILEHGLTMWQNTYRGTRLAPLLTQVADTLPPRLVRCSVQRADHLWIAFRGGRMNAEDLHSRRVALLGCGSLGSGVAELLARSGVGELTLVDSEVLTYDNIGRSTIGAEAVGQNKAEALKAKIECALPHVSCTAIPKSWTTIANKLPTFDLTISTMAIWQENMLLNRIAVEASIRPIIYAWLEPHALAAHAVCIRTAQVCMECGFTVDGRPKLVATAWDEDTRQPEPGCGGMFQPYGVIDLAPAHALIAELALDALALRIQEATRRTWLGNGARLVTLGGHWDPIWEARYGAIEGGRTMIEVSWSGDPGCPACGRI